MSFLDELYYGNINPIIPCLADKRYSLLFVPMQGGGMEIIMKISGELKKYSRITFDFDVPTDSIKIIRPDGIEDTVYPFIYQPITVSYDSEGIEKTEIASEQSA